MSRVRREMPVYRRISGLVAVMVVALAMTSSAWAGAYNYAASYYWPAGQGAATGFSPSWYRNTFYKNTTFDTTITFIDNVSYSWHATVRSYGTYVETHWLSSQVKKAHCRANSAASTWAACTAYS
jgi:hypothetical protein